MDGDIGVTPDRHQQRRIEQQEQWLREVCADTEGPDVDRIKMLVHIEVNEQWLAQQLHERVPADLADRTRRRVRAILSEGGHPHEKHSGAAAVHPYRHHLFRRLGGVAAAAAACLLVLVSVYRVPPASAELSFVDAFERFTDDKLNQSLAVLAEDVDDLEEAFVTRAVEDLDDALYDDLMDAIDGIMWKNGAGDDWSQPSPQGVNEELLR
jgi:hypothetical protein